MDYDWNYITVCTCDSCNRRSVGVMLHHYGTPVLFQCSTCSPREFERVARRDVDSWLEAPKAKEAA